MYDTVLMAAALSYCPAAARLQFPGARANRSVEDRLPSLRGTSDSFLGRRLRLSSRALSEPRCAKAKLSFPAVCQSSRSRETEDRGKAITVEVDAKQEDNAWPSTMQDMSKQFMDFCKDVFRAIQKPAAVALLVALMLSQVPSDAVAAQSGGRVGGRSFSAPSRSYSAPSRSSGSYSGPSRTYVAPPVGGGFVAPYFGGWGYGFGGPTVIVGPSVGMGYGFGGGISSFILFTILAFFVYQTVQGFMTTDEDGVYGMEKCSVARLQVGLLGSARSLQRDLEKIANRADTTEPEGLHYILTETVLSLLRHPDYCIYGYASSDVLRDVDQGEERFNQLSLEERGKLKEETLVNVGSVRKNKSSSFSSSGGIPVNNEYIVVTLLVATEGELKFPSINSSSDLKSALTTLGGVPASAVQAVEVLWTPQDPNDTLNERDLLQDYPNLRNL